MTYSDCREFLLDEEAALTLLTRQKRLTSLSMGPLTFKLAPFLKSGSLGQDLFANLTALKTPRVIGSLQDLDFYKYIIEHAPLRKLHVAAKSLHDGLEADNGNETAASDAIGSNLFEYIKSRHSTKKLQLEDVALKDFDVSLSDFALPKYVDFTTLTSLHLVNCPDGSQLIPLLGTEFANHGSKLQHFEFCLDSMDSLGAKVVDQFLASFSGLKILTLVGYDDCYQGYQGLESSLFDNHGSTLEELTLHPDGFAKDASDEMGIKPEFFANISKACRKLRQIAIPFPSVTLPNPIESQLYDWGQAMYALLKLPDLKTLRILSWPSFAPNFFSHTSQHEDHDKIAGLNGAVRKQEMDSFVTKAVVQIFNRHFPARTSPLLCFGNIGLNTVSDGIIEVDFDDGAYYVPLRQRDVFGKEQTALQQVEKSEIKYFEPEAGLAVWP